MNPPRIVAVLGAVVGLGMSLFATSSVASEPPAEVTVGVVEAQPADVAAMPLRAGWSCADSYCHAISHRSPDDGYNNPIYVLCGNNMVQYGLGIGQNSQALGCNDVNAFYLFPGHSINCHLQGGWVEIGENWGSNGIWSSNFMGAWGDHTTYLCVDAWAGTIGGGQGGGGGGGGTWRGGGGGGGSW